jgi:hypothetical protein
MDAGGRGELLLAPVVIFPELVQDTTDLHRDMFMLASKVWVIRPAAATANGLLARAAVTGGRCAALGNVVCHT